MPLESVSFRLLGALPSINLEGPVVGKTRRTTPCRHPDGALAAPQDEGGAAVAAVQDVARWVRSSSSHDRSWWHDMEASFVARVYLAQTR